MSQGCKTCARTSPWGKQSQSVQLPKPSPAPDKGPQGITKTSLFFFFHTKVALLGGGSVDTRKVKGLRKAGGSKIATSGKRREEGDGFCRFKPTEQMWTDRQVSRTTLYSGQKENVKYYIG